MKPLVGCLKTTACDRDVKGLRRANVERALWVELEPVAEKRGNNMLQVGVASAEIGSHHEERTKRR